MIVGGVLAVFLPGSFGLQNKKINRDNCDVSFFLDQISPVSSLSAFSLFLLTLVFFAYAGEIFTLDRSILESAEKKFGHNARIRLLSWQKLIRESEPGLSDIEKLERVNTFFNQLNFVSDAIHWQKSDYWATPIEFLASNGGDCEDFSLAKYFTLKQLGIPEIKLNLTYVKAWKLDQAHMVLTYYQSPESDPIVLDNLVNDILPASERSDLYPVYSFNGSGLWISKERGRGKLIGKSDRLSLWRDLLNRMPESLKTH